MIGQNNEKVPADKDPRDLTLTDGHRQTSPSSETTPESPGECYVRCGEIHEVNEIEGSSEAEDVQEVSGERGRQAAANSESPIPYRLPLAEFISWAVSEHHATQPDPERYRTELWTFTRLIRGRFFEAEMTAEEAFDRVDKIIRQNGGSWADQFPSICNYEAAYAEFVSNWDKVRFPPGYRPLEVALRKPLSSPSGLSVVKSDPCHCTRSSSVLLAGFRSSSGTGS